MLGCQECEFFKGFEKVIGKDYVGEGEMERRERMGKNGM